MVRQLSGESANIVDSVFNRGTWSNFLCSEQQLQEKLELDSVSLIGDALNWYNWEIHSSQFANWSQFKSKLLKRFGNPPIRGPSLRLFCIKQKGTISEYVNQFEDLSAQVTGLDDRKLQRIFLCGLTQDMQEKIHELQPQNLPEIIAFARSLESHDATVAMPKEPSQEETSKSIREEE